MFREIYFSSLQRACVIKIYRNYTSLVFVIIKTSLRTTDGHGYYCNYLYLLYECNRWKRLIKHILRKYKEKKGKNEKERGNCKIVNSKKTVTSGTRHVCISSLWLVIMQKALELRKKSFLSLEVCEAKVGLEEEEKKKKKKRRKIIVGIVSLRFDYTVEFSRDR